MIVLTLIFGINIGAIQYPSPDMKTCLKSLIEFQEERWGNSIYSSCYDPDTGEMTYYKDLSRDEIKDLSE